MTKSLLTFTMKCLRFNRPFHGLASFFMALPAVNCWAIFSRPLRGLVEMHFLGKADRYQ